MRSERQIDEPRLTVVDNQIMSLRFRVKGGRTGDHFVQYLAGEWRCDCIGWQSNKMCRHVKAGSVMLEFMQNALQEIDRRESENWQ